MSEPEVPDSEDPAPVLPEPGPELSPDAPRLLVVIGSSAGGIPALRALLARLPADSPLAIVLMQHTDPTRMEELRKVLAADCALPMELATDGAMIAPGHVYVVPSDADCEVADERFRLLTTPKVAGTRHSIDHAMVALSHYFGERTVGVVLSGSGMDGLQGMRAVRAAGGVTVVQDPASAEYLSMPESVIGADLADLILTPEEIPAELARILQWGGTGQLSAVDPKSLDPVLRLIHRKTGFDFGQYKEGTVRRRVGRRLLVNHCETLDDYRRLLVRDTEEADALARDLLISVTSFFRDGAIFQALSGALRPLVEACGAGDAIRVWVPACASGEEAYSIAMVLAELLGDRIGRVKVQIFATDIDAAAIREARQACFRAESVREVPEPLLGKYFESWDGQYRIRRELRDMVVFAEHDLTQDPPFTKLNLISCRNALIYFKRALQELLLVNFHYALRPGGLLMLGSSESADRYARLFSRADPSSKLYRRNEIEGAPPAQLYRRATPPLLRRPPAQARAAATPEERTREMLMSAYTPPCALVNVRQELIYVQGAITPYVRLPQGEINVNLVEMATTPDIRVELRLVLNRVLRERVRVSSHPLSLPDTDPPRELRIIGLPGDDDALVVFEETEASRPAEAAAEGTPGSAARVAELEKELAATREHLHANIEELEAANEELQSTNEEHQSTSEELQSTVEEFQTTNEELQSTNEELNTVNEELSAKSEALEATNTDMQGVLDNVAAAIIVLDRSLNVTRYSAASKQIFDLWPTTIGRPFIGIGGALDLGVLSRDIHQAVRSRKPIHRDMAMGEKIYDVRIIPRLDRAGSLGGLIIVFTDETARAEADKQARLLSTVVRNSNDAIIVYDLEDRIVVWNAAAVRLLDYTEDQALGRDWTVLIPPELRDEAAARAQSLLEGNAAASEQTRWLTRAGDTVEVGVTASVLRDDAGQPYACAMIVRDVGETLRAGRKLRAAMEEAERANQTKTRFLAAASHDLRQPLQSLAMYVATALGDFGEDRRRQALERMQAALGSMRRLLNALLDLSRLDAGQIEPHEQVFALEPLLDRVCAQAGAEAEDKGLSLRHVASRAQVRSDPVLLEELISNLVFNAVRHAGQGGVVVGARRRGQELRIDVCDTGPGIPEDQREAIFDEFVQLPDDGGAKREGLGLGLSIVRRLALLLGHRLELQSEVGRGTRFSVAVPRAAGPAAPEAAADSPAMARGGGGNLLLVDDDASVRDATALLLELEGYQVARAASADEALASAAALRPDIIVSDYLLGDSATGPALVGKLRESLSAPGLPGLIVTGQSGAEVEPAIRAAGCDMQLKPVETAELLDAIRKLLDTRASSG